MSKLRFKYNTVGDVRGKGLMLGIELVAGDGTTTPLDPDRFTILWEYTRNAGLLVGNGGLYGNVTNKKKFHYLFLC